MPQTPGQQDLEDTPLGIMPNWTAGQTLTYRTTGYWDALDTLTIVAYPVDGVWHLGGFDTDPLMERSPGIVCSSDPPTWMRPAAC